MWSSAVVRTESIAWFMEDQVFLLLYDLAPPSPPPTLLPSASCLSFSVFLYVAGRVELTEGRGAGE
jgi:hypothetical protein